jgi:polyhydroxyalkanoate synthase subunit PhaC
MKDKATSDAVSEADIAALRRMAAEHLSGLLDGWMNPSAGKSTPSGLSPSGPLPEPAGEALLENFQAWLNPFKASPPPFPVDSEAMREFMAGLEAYKQHPVQRESGRPMEVIWRQGTTALRDMAPQNAGQPAILIVPSLINRYGIFDLAPDHSFLGYLAAHGFRPLVVDWDAPGDEEKEFTVSDYMTRRLMPLFDFLAGKIPGGRVHIVGYCMGGLLALALALLRGGAARSLSLMATPWNFAAAGTPPAAMTGEGGGFSKLADQTEPYLASCGSLPAEALRAFFASFQPAQVVEKFARFSGVDPASTEAERFVLSEDWLNDGVPLAAPVARECLREWYGENKPGRILWRTAGELIDPRLLDCPAYVVAPAKDQLVPPESSRPLARFIRGAVLQEPALGHIGLLASQTAPQEVWAPLVTWLRETETK